mmetsp:Transcript_6663/g.10537  ORF Transcript_6663/g.10537 Transcript_6663/m.10537 type:complete len:361 (+) Transcript_6663:327-1409(+)|eukprot:CAMPEP_0184301524 /NCGR_PEP_ID=MMETSP1049-20130417/11703_1 /TAXON_ID=77928 /ORGANISM="Proteomonas sulcata, Strain CCMP704" /LENGTH=360 /DNA_ID=CAMNT_0026612551 /DNA_START=258 /DNA_END=1340 /DNA_ORIENTATION=-
MQAPKSDEDDSPMVPNPANQEESKAEEGNSQSLSSPAGAGYNFVEVDYPDIFRQFVILGWTAFGGPAAHIALFRKTFIEELKWMPDSVFMEFFALGQCLPGPTSTQVSFAIGVVKKGIYGGLLSGMLFQYPGLLMMTIIGWVAADFDWKNDRLQGFAAGLSAVGVALVAGAALALTTKTCPDKPRKCLCILACCVAMVYSTAWVFPALILLGGIVTYAKDQMDGAPVAEAPGNEGIDSLGVSKTGGAMLIGTWIGILILTVIMVNTLPYEGAAKGIFWFESFFRTGSIIFGGGQVVLPLIVNELVKETTVCNLGVDGVEICSPVPDYMAHNYNFSDPRLPLLLKRRTPSHHGRSITHSAP